MVTFTGPARNVALAFDSAGNLYVMNGYPTNTITVYAPGSESVLRTISKGIDDPVGLALDGSSNLYVTNFDGGTQQCGTVTVYAPGSNAVLRTISKGVAKPLQLAFDGSGNLYVSSSTKGKNLKITPPAARRRCGRSLGECSILRRWLSMASETSTSKTNSATT